LIATEQDNWQSRVRSCLNSSSLNDNPVTLAGIGNPIKCDDSVGLYIISQLRRKFGANPAKGVWAEPPSYNPESVFSKIGKRTGIIFDAVECNRKPGTIIFANVGESKYGFFATHNVPLKLVPGIAENSSKIFVLGVQPANTEVGEGLSPEVIASANKIVELVSELISGINSEGS
jgi:hydrogenase maturation protease